MEVLEGAEGLIAKSDSVKILFEALNGEDLEKCLELLKRHKMSTEHVYHNNFLALRQ